MLDVISSVLCIVILLILGFYAIKWAKGLCDEEKNEVLRRETIKNTLSAINENLSSIETSLIVISNSKIDKE